LNHVFGPLVTYKSAKIFSHEIDQKYETAARAPDDNRPFFRYRAAAYLKEETGAIYGGSTNQ
jgi:hypothetical protein